MVFLREIFNFVLPGYCSLCKKRLQEWEKSICDECWSRIEVIVSPFCERCGRPGEAGVCNECIQHPHEFTRARALGEYKGVLSEVILVSKGRRPKISVWRRLGGLLGRVLADDEVMNKADGLVPVPLYSVRERERGYNQSKILCKEVSNYTGIPVMNKTLFQTRPTRPQKSFAAENLPAEEERKKREENVRGAFRAKEGIGGEKLILVDDVCTTGATLDECARELYKAGADGVYGLVVARA